MVSITLYIFCFCIVFANAHSCSNPVVSSSYYTSTNEKLTKNTVFVIEFSLKCSGSNEKMQLYANVDGLQMPVTTATDGDKYQVSWTVKDKKTQRRVYDVRFFDEEGYGLLRKAIRSGQDEASVKPMFVINLNHPGLSSGFWVRSELLGLAGASLLFYFACKERSQVIA